MAQKSRAEDGPGPVAPRLEPGLEFTGDAAFPAASIAEFARLVGDGNPLHHDAAAAASSRFGGLIASGAQTVSVMMSLVATRMSDHWPNVGLGYSVRLRRPVMADTRAVIRWRVVSVEDSARLGGRIVTLDGTLTREDGEVAVTGTCQALVMDQGVRSAVAKA